MMKLVIFDLDGTLLNTINDLAAAMNRVIAKRGFTTLESSEYAKMLGHGIANLCKTSLARVNENFGLLNEEEQEREAKAFRLEFTDEYKRHLCDYTEYYPGIRTILASLSSKYQLAVLSNKEDDLTKKIIAEYFPDISFVFVEGRQDPWPRKPDPAFALHLIDKAGIKPEEVYFVGDAGTDMNVAKNAGFTSIWVSWGYRTLERISVKPDYLAYSVEDLAKHLGLTNF